MIGRQALDLLLPRLSGAVLALDFDGTLAPIVDDPDRAAPAPGALVQLQRLAPLVRTLAIVTGRPAEVVVRLGHLEQVPGLVVLGQYGAERWTDGRHEGAEPLAGVAAARSALAALLEHEPGARLEDKAIALVVHVRRCPDPAGALRRLEGPVRRIADREGLAVHPGRSVLEVRPPGFDKGGALGALCEPQPDAALFAGDDLGDLPAFDALDALAARGVPVLRVASRSEESPPELLRRADVQVDGPAGVVELLAALT